MEKEKHFIPEISDLFVGYECEIINYASNNYNKDKSTCKWNKFVLKKEHLFSSYDGSSFLETCVSCLNFGELRVPFLTKEQIENEDWEFTEQIGNTMFFKKKDFEFTFNTDRIEINNVGEYDLGYWGKCKDINTFKYICKLLEI